MSEMQCPKCKKLAPQLTADHRGLGCCFCQPVEKINALGVLHKVKCKKWGVKLMETDANRIKTNKKRADGQYRPDPRWQTSGD